MILEREMGTRGGETTHPAMYLSINLARQGKCSLGLRETQRKRRGGPNLPFSWSTLPPFTAIPWAAGDRCSRQIDSTFTARRCEEKFKAYTLRAECEACETRFSADVPEGDTRDQALRCPNCGEAVERPPRPVQIADVAIP